MVNTISESFTFSLRPSRRWQWLNACLHGVGVLLVLAVCGPRWQEPAYAIAGLVLAIAFVANGSWLAQQLRRPARHGVTTLRYDGNGWLVGTSAQTLRDVVLAAGTTITPFAIALHWREPSRRTGWLLIVPDQLEADAFRRLSRLLWQAGKPVAPSTEPL